MNEREEGCPLCGICEREPENVLYEDEHFAIIRTADLKGHHERVMLILKDIYRIYRHTYHTTSHG